MGYWEELEKLKRERLEKGRSNYNKMLYRNKTATAVDIAPVVSTAASVKAVEAINNKVKAEKVTEEVTEEKKNDKWYEGWFKAPTSFDSAEDAAKTYMQSVADLGANITGGLLEIGEGVVDAGAMAAGWVGGLFGADEFKEKTGEFVKKDLYDGVEVAKKYNPHDDLAKLIADKVLGIDVYGEEYSVFDEKTDSLAQSGGQLAGTAMLQMVGVPWWLTSGVTSFGSSSEDALNQGATYDEAALNGLISAGAELLTEKMFGGSGLGEKGLINLDGLTKGITSKAVKALADWGLDIVQEGSEEIASEFISTLGQQLTYEKEETWDTLLSDEKAMDAYIHQLLDSLIGKDARNRYAEAFVGGAALGGGMNVGKVTHSVKANEDYRSGLTANEEAVVNKEVENRIAEKEADGETLTKKDKAEIYEKVVEDMKRGYISTDTIEEVLSGEGYKAYDGLVKESEEYNELYNTKSGELSEAQKDRLAELKAKNEAQSYEDQIKAARDKLSSDTFNLLKGERNGAGSLLGESYNERARRGQKYEADLTKYNEKQKAVVQKAIDSGILNNTNRTHEFVDMVAKISADKGVLFDFTDNAKLKESGFAIDGKSVNGYVTKDGVTLNIDSKKALDTVAGHEITHVLEGTELYGELQKAIFDYAKSKGEYQGRYDTLTRLYEGVEGADVDAELTADLVGDYLFSDSDFINKLSTEHRNVFQKIYDEIKYLCKVATAGSKEARELERVKRAFEKAYKEGGKAGADTKYSISDSNITDESTGYAYGESYYTMSYKRDGKVVGTLEYGEYNGEPNVKMIEVDPEYRRQGIGTKLLQELQKKYPDTEIDFGMSTPDGTKLLDSITYNVTDEAVVADRQKLKDLQTELNDLQEKLDVLYDTENLTEAQENELHKLGDRWQEVYETIHDLEQSLRGKRATKTFVKTDAKYSLSDSDGRKLTNNQLKYFEGSKVVDDSGKLKAVYHGSPADFNEFSLKYLGTNGTNEGYGFYFTDSKRIAEGYSKGREGQQNGETGRLFEVYLDIKKPLSDTEVTMSRSQFKKLLTALNNRVDSDGERLDILSNYGDVEWEGLNKVLNYAMEIEYDGSDSDVSMIHSLINGCGDMTAVFDELRKVTGYDGIIVNEASWGGDQTIYIAFHPEQIKNVDNQNPTNNPDIRKSLSAEGDTSRRYGNVYGEDVRFNAPVAEDLTESTETAKTTENTAPIQNAVHSENEGVADAKNLEPSAAGLAEIAMQARREELRGAYNENGRQYISDGSFIAELNTVDESIEQSESFPAKRVKNELAEAFERQSGENYELDVAGIDEGYIKVGDSLFDSKYVNAVIRAIENPVFTLSNVRGGHNALLVSGDNGRAVLMPVRAGDNVNVAFEARQVAPDALEDIMPEGFAPVTEEEANTLASENLASLDDADAPAEVETEYYEALDNTRVDDKAVKDISKSLADVLALDAKETEAIGNVVQRYSTGEISEAELFDEIKSKFSEKTVEHIDEQTAEVKRALRDYKLFVSDAIKGDIPEYNNLRKKLFGRLFTKTRENGGMPVDTAYMELSERYPGYFPEDIINPTDQFLLMAQYAQDDAKTHERYKLDDEDIQSAVDVIVSEVGKSKEAAVMQNAEEDRRALMDEIAPVAEKTPDKAYEAIRPPKQSGEPQMKRAEPRMKRADSTKTAPDGMEERSWYETSTGSEAVDNMITPDDIPDDVRYYQVKSNEKTLAAANARLAKDGYAKSREYFEGRMSERKLSVEDIALGERLIQEAAKAGDAKAVRDLIIDVSIIGTELGQRVQALSMIRRLTPEGQLKALTRTVERGKAKGDKAFDGVEVTEDMTKRIIDTVKKDGTFDQAELNAAVEDVKQQIADQMSVGAMDYINAWRYLSMLGNPKTHIRNLVSNVAMFGTRTVKNAVARTAEDVFLRKKKPVLITDDIAPTIGDTAQKGEVKGQQQMFSEAQPTRTKTWKRASDVVKDFAKQTTKEMESAIKGENKYSDEGGIKAKRNIFKTKAGNWMANANNTAMDFEDSIFSKQAFQQTLSEYLTANGIKTEADIKNNPALVEKAKDYALEEARKATFRQDSYLANKISEIERKNPLLNMAIGSIMPFKKTPINVAKTGLAYSPLGFARNIYDAVQVGRGKMDASEAIDHLAQTFTGSALALIGYALAEAGLLNGAGDDDKEGKYDYQLGEQSYSFNFGGDSYSLSWLSPVAMPLFVGANAYEQLVEGKEWNPDVVTEALAQTLDPLSEMSFISSLNDVLSSYDSGVAKIWGAGESMIQNYITQFVPTLSSQIAQTADDTKRSTKVAADSTFKFGEETLNKIKYKIPGLRNTLEPTTDIWGNEVKQSENILERGFEAFFSPANKRAGITTAVDEEIKDLYGQTGDAGVMPSIPDNYINYDGNKYEMSAKDFTEYKELYGQNAFDLMEQLFDTETYKNADSETRADMVNRIYDYARDEARKAYFTKFGVDFTNATLEGEEVYKENPIKGAIEADLPVDEYVFSKDYPAKYSFFKKNGISYETYKAADEDGKRAYTWAYENPGKYQLSKAISDDFLEFYGIRDKMNDFNAKDSNGNSVSGLKKERVTEYINGLDLDYGQKIILFRSMYDSKEDKNTYNAEIVEYLNSRGDIGYSEMVTILKELGMTVDRYGNVSW